jgi:hypothetical protein
MRRLFPILVLTLAACTTSRTAPEDVIAPAPGWRSLAAEGDRQRLREWRTAWVRALAKGRGAGHGAEIAKEGALLKPDAALDDEAGLPPGDYRCRTIKMGAKSEGMPDYLAYQPFACRVGAPDGAGVRSFAKLTGSQRQVGRIYPESHRRMIFLGTLQLGDEKGVLRYGHDRNRDLLGVVERVGARQWRIAFPYPAFESTLDVLELVPAD